MQGIISEPKDILVELMDSRDSGRVIGIRAAPLGRDFSFCSVENVFDDDIEHDKVIILNRHDVRGNPLPVHVLLFQEIQEVFSYPLRDHPAKNDRRERRNGDGMRKRSRPGD